MAISSGPVSQATNPFDQLRWRKSSPPCFASLGWVETGVPDSGFEWPRYPRVLVAIDETPAAAFALRHVVPYAVDQRSRLTLLTVVPDPPRVLVAGGVSPQRMAEEME